MSLNEDSLLEFVHRRKFDNTAAFYLALRQEKVDPDEVIGTLQEELKHPHPVAPEEEHIDGLFNRFITSARNTAPGIVLNGTHDNFMHHYAKCCHPIPGDEVVGYVTTGEGIKIHRRSCKNIEGMMRLEPNRIMEVNWPAETVATFVAGIKIAGDDRQGMLSDVTHAISSYLNTNIRSVNIDAQDSVFDGTFIVDVKDTGHLERILEKIRRVPGVKRAERFEE
jgi:guanosine-3',5'-bis(diphosphate) 3'-pyrophosphohydrolase